MHGQPRRVAGQPLHAPTAEAESPTEHRVVESTGITDLSREVLTRILQHLPAAVPAVPALTEGKMLARLRTVSSAFRRSMDHAFHTDGLPDCKSAPQKGRLAEIGRCSTREAVVHMARRGLSIAGFRAAISQVIGNACHIGVDLNRLPSGHHQLALLKTLEEKTGLRSLEVKALPENATEVLDTLMVVQNQNRDMAHFELNFNAQQCAVKLSSANMRNLGKLTALTRLDLSHNEIGDGGTAEVAKIHDLNALNLSRNGITEAGAAFLSKVAGLTWLDMSHNTIGDAGAVEIAKLVRLNWLDASCNNIGLSGALSLRTLPEIALLDLSMNHVNAAGAA